MWTAASGLSPAELIIAAIDLQRPSFYQRGSQSFPGRRIECLNRRPGNA